MESIRIGLIADVQYCDRENGWNYKKTQERFYRNSVNQLDDALEYFSTNNCHKVLQLGDLMDGQCRSKHQYDEASQLISKRFERDDLETFHILGNHELYNLSRDDFCNSFMGTSLRKYQKLNINRNYYRVDLAPKICLLVIDTFDVSVLSQNEETDENYLAALKILAENNPNVDQNSPIGTTQLKYVAFNGAVGKSQRQWLYDQLVECTRENKIVILAGKNFLGVNTKSK